MNTSDVTLDMTKRLAGLPSLMELRRGPITSDGRFEELRDSLLSSAFFGDDMVVVWLLEGCSGVLLTTILIFYGVFTTCFAACGFAAVYVVKKESSCAGAICFSFAKCRKDTFSSGRRTTI